MILASSRRLSEGDAVRSRSRNARTVMGSSHMKYGTASGSLRSEDSEISVLSITISNQA